MFDSVCDVQKRCETSATLTEKSRSSRWRQSSRCRTSVMVRVGSATELGVHFSATNYRGRYAARDCAELNVFIYQTRRRPVFYRSFGGSLVARNGRRRRNPSKRRRYVHAMPPGVFDD